MIENIYNMCNKNSLYWSKVSISNIFRIQGGTLRFTNTGCMIVLKFKSVNRLCQATGVGDRDALKLSITGKYEIWQMKQTFDNNKVKSNRNMYKTFKEVQILILCQSYDTFQMLRVKFGRKFINIFFFFSSSYIIYI